MIAPDFQVRHEQLGDNDEAYAIWDNSRTPPRIVKLYRTKSDAEAAATALRDVYANLRTKEEE